jgi:RNA polymerase sigma-70 factor (ECF subfamily)
MSRDLETIFRKSHIQAEAGRIMWRMDSRAEPDGPTAASPQAGGTPSGAAEPEIDDAIRAAQDGDETAFRALYRHVQPRMLRFLGGLVGADAEDVASDAWLQIARDLESFHGDADMFRGWATRIARNRAIDHLRYVKRRPVVDLPSETMLELMGQDNTERAALDRLSTEKAVEMIAALPRDQAEAVLLRVVMGLDAKDAGRVLGKRPGAVRTAAHRGLRTLARRLEGRDGVTKPGSTTLSDLR